jgi:PQQ-like domain
MFSVLVVRLDLDRRSYCRLAAMHKDVVDCRLAIAATISRVTLVRAWTRRLLDASVAALRSTPITRNVVLGHIACVLACSVLLAACGGSLAAGAPSSPASAAAASPSPGDWTRFNYDAARTGVDPASTGITARNLGRLRVRRIHLDGTVDSSAIELHGIVVRRRARDVIIVTTTYGRTIALDAGTGAKLWEYVPPDIHGYQGTPQITTATPIADPGRRYVFAATPDGRIRKLALANGHEVHSGHWPVAITFDATHEKIASALNISGNSVVVVTGGYIGDAPPYQGHVVLIDRGTGRVSHVWNSLCSHRRRLIVPSSCGSSDSAIWGRAGAVIEPDTGRVLVATGNAPFNGSNDWGDSALELAPDASRLLHNWTPSNQAQLANSDADVGSTAPAVLPKVGGLRLAVQGGKDGTLHLLNLDRLDGTRGGAGPRLGGEVGEVSTPGSGQMFTAPVVWSHAGRAYLFVGVDNGTAAYVLRTGGHPGLSIAWQNATPGTSPVLAGGLLYVYDQVDGQLRVYDPASGHPLASLPAANGHWNSPIAVNGRIILPVGNSNDHLTSGSLFIYHLPGR